MTFRPRLTPDTMAFDSRNPDAPGLTLRRPDAAHISMTIPPRMTGQPECVTISMKRHEAESIIAGLSFMMWGRAE